MSQGADTADQMVQEGIQVTESAVKLAALGVKNLAVLVLQLLKDNKKLNGKTELNSLLQTDKPLTTFTVNRAGMPQFQERAGTNAVPFSTINHARQRNQCEIIVKADDAAMVRRIFESIQQPAQVSAQSQNGKANQNWFQQAAERLTDPARRAEGKTGPLEGLGAETLAALVYKLAAENRQHMEASPLSRIMDDSMGVQFVEVPAFCKRDVLENAEILDIPIHMQASQTDGKMTMMARSEDAGLVNRLFENMGMDKPMVEGKVAPAQQRPAEKEQPAKAEPDKGAGEKGGRSSVKVAFGKAKADAAAAGKSPMVAAHKAVAAKPAKSAAR